MRRGTIFLPKESLELGAAPWTLLSTGETNIEVRRLAVAIWSVPELVLEGIRMVSGGSSCLVQPNSVGTVRKKNRRERAIHS